ncbi:MAG: hypothetical protein F6J94_19710 [Moorea sp. SIO1F2]|uniref:hypothetical protein n=1 Tax=Moorena sp. SIO1F2 TaxID=2607819 RepID=UPI0013BA39C9|nr:hypothetical protein [Moorena sp. SIO1F2]NET84061.1 hypothetical protein [Moorena sp. SIO1F2]
MKWNRELRTREQGMIERGLIALHRSFLLLPVPYSLFPIPINPSLTLNENARLAINLLASAICID